LENALLFSNCPPPTYPDHVGEASDIIFPPFLLRLRSPIDDHVTLEGKEEKKKKKKKKKRAGWVVKSPRIGPDSKKKHLKPSTPPPLVGVNMRCRGRY